MEQFDEGLCVERELSIWHISQGKEIGDISSNEYRPTTIYDILILILHKN